MINVKNLKNEVNICPFCENDSLDYGDSEFDSNTISYPWKCRKCGHEGIEWYKTTFDGHDVYDDDKNIVSLNK